jgi:hypothetical protein
VGDGGLKGVTFHNYSIKVGDYPNVGERKFQLELPDPVKESLVAGPDQELGEWKNSMVTAEF